jgi:GxxExxY protein
MAQILQIRPNNPEIQYIELTDKIIKAFYKVYDEMGPGFQEKVYENALFLELRAMGIFCVKQRPIQVYYNSQIVGEYFANIMVNDSIIINLRTSDNLDIEDELALLNCLKATENEIGLLLNFGKNPQFKRKIFTNDRKNLFSYNTPAIAV